MRNFLYITWDIILVLIVTHWIITYNFSFAWYIVAVALMKLPKKKEN